VNVTVEAKLGKSSTHKQADAQDEEDSSDEEDEDEDGELATEALDSEIVATLKAIRSHDPRVYDKDAKFYSEATEAELSAPKDKTEKPMYLRDYHRQNLLNGGDVEESQDTPKTFVQQQEDLKKSVIGEINAAENDQSSDDDEDGDFLVAKSRPLDSDGTEAPLDVENAEKDPETFLSNFLTSRAWIPAKSSTQFQPFESDDEEEDQKAEQFEEAYNFRFEDPNKMNETLMRHARDTANDFSVRREDTSSRKKKRDTEREKKEEVRRERESQKNRLRKLKMEELEEKVGKIKQAAGLKAAGITEEEWVQFLDDNWDDDKWEREMAKRFGEEYYAEDDMDLNGDEDDEKKKRKPKKPTWDDDIDIKDLVPDFDDEAEPGVRLSDDGEENEEADEEEDGENDAPAKKKSRTQEKHDQKRAARKERRRIEEAVERNLDLDPTLLPGATKKNASQFRYRETSPQSFGLTPRDILMADDSQLNQFVGLKKLAAFRDPERKRRDLKKMGKKARLRQWRKETFGTENEPEFELKQAPAAAAVPEEKDDEMKVDIREGGSRKKRKRSKKH
jgi:protein KRI1